MLALAPAQYKDILLFLATAGLIVPIFRRLRLSPVIGFLCAGAVLGPYGLGEAARHIRFLGFVAFEDVHDIEPIADFGVVFLLFTIGLELSWERLTRLRRLVFGLGALQLFVSSAILGGAALLLRQTPGAALILGAALALSSTAVIIPVMAEKKRLGTSAGRTVFSVLLFQDLMVAPLIFLVTMLSIRSGDLLLTLAYTLLPAAMGLFVVVAGGRLLVRPLFHHVAEAGSTEFFMAACLLVVIGAGVLTAVSGLSMGLGAFVAGLLLAETEYRREIEVTIEPFRGLLLGLFFVAVGAGLDFTQVVSHPRATLGLGAAFILVKLGLTFGAARAMRLPWRVATETSLMLAPGGEFAFVLMAAAVGGKVVPGAVATDVDIAVTLSLFCVPALGWVSRRVTRRMPSADMHLAEVPAASAAAPRAILVGYGRVGQLIGDMMRKHKISYLAVEDNVTVVRNFRRAGIDITWGNAGRIEFLDRCGLATASALVITINDADVAEEIVRQARERRPDLTIVARARDAERAARLYALGATDAVPETIEASLQLSEAVLTDMGLAMGLVIASVHEKRDEYRKVLQPVAGKAEERRKLKMSMRVKEMNRRVDAARRVAEPTKADPAAEQADESPAES